MYPSALRSRTLEPWPRGPETGCSKFCWRAACGPLPLIGFHLCTQPFPPPAAELIKSQAFFHTFEKFKGTHILGRSGSAGTWI